MDIVDIKKRSLYLDRIHPHIGKNIIKVIVGHRRSGKSYLMLNMIETIKSSNPQANVIYINKEHYEFDGLRHYHDLQAYFDKKLIPGSNNYFFVDEIQEIAGFEKCIRNILSKNLADIYISGSNAQLFSSELASLLSGRYIEIKVHPLSYTEFLEFFQLEYSDLSFYRYLRQGGMPGLIHIDPDYEPINDYLKGILSRVVLKDVVARHNIRNVYFLENLIRFLAGNIGSLVSAKNISDFLKSQKLKVSPNLVLDYLNYLCNSFITNKVPRMDIAGRKIFEISEKYYFEDLGLRNTLIGYNPADVSKLLENVVYNHLIIAGYNVFVGRLGVKEIDFIAERKGETIYVQVSYLLSDENVLTREYGNLLAISDNYKKYVVSMDEFQETTTYKGIEFQRIPDFCKMLMTDNL